MVKCHMPLKNYFKITDWFAFFQQSSRRQVSVVRPIVWVWVLQLRWAARSRNFEKEVPGQEMEEVPAEIGMTTRRVWRTCLEVFYPRDKVSSISSAVSSWADTPPPITTITINNSRFVPILSFPTIEVNALVKEGLIRKAIYDFSLVIEKKGFSFKIILIINLTKINSSKSYINSMKFQLLIYFHFGFWDCAGWDLCFSFFFFSNFILIGKGEVSRRKG